MDEYRHQGKSVKRITLNNRVLRLERSKRIADLIFAFHYVLIVGLIISQVIIYARYIK